MLREVIYFFSYKSNVMISVRKSDEYISPVCEVTEISVECGFAHSLAESDGGILLPELDWGGYL